MSRLRRIHIPRGVYFVEQNSKNHDIYTGPDDLVNFGVQMPPALRKARARVHAFYVARNAFYLAVQVRDRPVSILMDHFKARLVRTFNQHHGLHGPLLRERYRALLIDPHEYFLRLIRYIHWLPELSGIAAHNECVSSSDFGYRGLASPPWLTTTVAMGMLAPRKEKSQRAYTRFMDQRPSDQDIHDFQHGSAQDPRVLGRPIFLRQLPQDVLPYKSVKTLDEVIQLVAINRQMSIDDMFSHSKRRDLALARALVTWYATVRDIATLSTVSRRFGREPQTLYESMQLYQQRRPELFSFKAFMVPAQSIAQVATIQTPKIAAFEIDSEENGYDVEAAETDMPEPPDGAEDEIDTDEDDELS
jgi:hypothetical protein